MNSGLGEEMKEKRMGSKVKQAGGKMHRFRILLVISLFFGLFIFNWLFQQLDQDYICLRCGERLHRSCYSCEPRRFHIPLSRIELFSRTMELETSSPEEIPMELLNLLHGKTSPHKHLWGMTFQNTRKNAFISRQFDGHGPRFWSKYWERLKRMEPYLRLIIPEHPQEARIIAESMLLCSPNTAENHFGSDLLEALENLDYSPGGWEKFWSRFGPLMKSEEKPAIFQE